MKPIKLLITFTVALVSLTTSAQVITNLPTVPLADETIGVSTGPLMRGASTFQNSMMIDYSVSSAFFVRAEVVSGSSDDVVEALGLGGGVYKSFATARAYGFLEGRRNWTQDAWEGVGGLGAAWTPLQNGALQNFSLFAEERIVISRDKGQPGTETVAGIRYSF